MSSISTRVAVLLLVLLTGLGACGSDSSETVTANDAIDPTTTTADGSTGDVDKIVEDVEGVTRFWIKPELVDCVGEAPQRCMQIAEAEDGEYLLFYDQIAGFEFEEGISYVIDVRVDDVFDPPADASSLSYTLVEVVAAE